MLRTRHKKRMSLLALTSSLAAIACTPSADAVNSIQNEQARANDPAVAGDAPLGEDDDLERSAPFSLARHSGGLAGGRLTRLSGELTLRGACLTLRGPQGEHALVWPRGAALRPEADGKWAIDLATPRGHRSLGLGDRITVGGYGGARSAVEGPHIVDKLASDCPDKAWIVQGLG